jgi:O-antigen/teichoic acid export membrane protein
VACGCAAEFAASGHVTPSGSPEAPQLAAPDEEPEASARRLTPGALLRRLHQDALLRNSAIYLAGGVGAGLFGYIFHFATGRLLGPAGYAVVAAVLSALYLASLPGLVMQTVAMRFAGIHAGRGQLGAVPGLLARLTVGSLLLGLTGAVGLVVLAPAVAAWLHVSDPRAVYTLAVAAALGLLVTGNRGALQGLRRFAVLSANAVLDMGGRVVAAVALITAGAGVAGGLLALVIGPALAYLHSLFALRHLRAQPSGAAAPLAEVGRYAVGATVGAFGTTFIYNVDVLLAKHYLSPEAAGIYAGGAVLGRVVYFLGNTVVAVMFPEVATRHARSESHFGVVDRSLLLVGSIGVLLIAGYLALPGLVLLPYGPSFAAVTPYLGPFAVALTLLALSNLLVNYFLSIGSVRFVVPLVGACLLETLLIVLFHDGIGQILTMVVLSSGALAVAMGLVYAGDRLGRPRYAR